MILDKLQKFNLKNKIIVSLVGFTLAFFCLVYFIVIPTMKDIQIMGRDIEAQRIDLEKRYIKGYSLRQLMENLRKIQPKLNLLDQIFINKNRELEFITALENEANQAQVSQKINLSSPQATENQEFQKNSLQLYTGGGFMPQLEYLLNLETLSYYINIKLLELTPANGPETARSSGQEPLAPQNQTNNIVMSINADTYWK